MSNYTQINLIILVADQRNRPKRWVFKKGYRKVSGMSGLEFSSRSWITGRTYIENPDGCFPHWIWSYHDPLVTKWCYVSRIRTCWPSFHYGKTFQSSGWYARLADKISFSEFPNLRLRSQSVRAGTGTRPVENDAWKSTFSLQNGHFSWAILNIESVYLHLDAIPTITNRRIIASYCFNASSPPSKWESSRHHLRGAKKKQVRHKMDHSISQSHGGACANTFKIIYQLPVTSYPMAYGIKSPIYFWALFHSYRFPMFSPSSPNTQASPPHMMGVPPPCQPSTIFKPPQPKHGGFCSSRSQLFMFSDLLQVLKYQALLRNTGYGSTDFSMSPLLRLDIEY